MHIWVHIERIVHIWIDIEGIVHIVVIRHLVMLMLLLMMMVKVGNGKGKVVVGGSTVSLEMVALGSLGMGLIGRWPYISVSQAPKLTTYTSTMLRSNLLMLLRYPSTVSR